MHQRRSPREARRALWVHGLPPRRAAVLGAVAVGVFSLIIAASKEHLGCPAQALLLVMPVITTAVLGERRPAQLSAVVADDLVALVVFSIVDDAGAEHHLAHHRRRSA